MNNKEPGVVDLASDSPDLKNKIAEIIAKLESDGVVDLEEQVSVLMTNMMNFFSMHIEEIPSFGSLSPEQQKALILRFKKVAHSLKTRKIKSVDEMLQTFIFTILSKLNERVESLEHLTAAEIMIKKHKQDFSEFLRKAASHEIYKLSNKDEISEKAVKEKDFIHNAVVLGVKEAMQQVGLKVHSREMNKEAFVILENAHKSFKKASKLLKGI